MNRDNISYLDAIKKISTQMDIEEKVKKTSYIIDNNKDKEITKKIYKMY